MSVDVVRALAITKDGKPIVAGLSRKGFRYMWALARYRADGSLDPSFGSGGRVMTQFGGGGADAIAVQPDGKLLVAGAAGLDSKGDTGFGLARYTVRGQLDPSFGRNGRVLTAFPRYSGEKFAIANAISVAVESDGKIVAAGWSGGTNSASFATLVRYTARGQLDQSFGQGGKVVLSNHGGLTAAAVEPDGKIVALGWIGQPAGPPVVVVFRLTTTGQLDTSFGQGRQVRVDSLADVPSSFLLEPNGKMVVAGNLDFANGLRAVLVRYTAEGKSDPSFGIGGQVVASDGPARLSALAREPDGKLVAAGSILPNPSEGGPGTFLLARYRDDGSLDPSFGQGGTTLKAFSLSEAVVQADGKIVTAGTSAGDFTVARYTTTGSLDAGFGSGGRVVTAFGPAWKTKLSSLSATRTSRGVLVRWRTASEFDLRGFNLYRGQGGIRRLVNRGLIRAKGAGLATSYSVLDRRAPRSTNRYWLQEVTVDSNLRWFGPVTFRG